MITPVAWLDRRFTFDLPVGLFPAILERLRGTPARAADLVRGIPEPGLERPVDGGWSVKQHLGHLDDLHPLDARRLDEFLAGARVLSAADMSNAATEAADHNRVPIAALLERLRERRLGLVRALDRLDERDVARTALHPRLRQPMRLIDWAYFVAEHDDHHLVRVSQAIARLRPPGAPS